ncbi:MAG: hypothetical protein AAGF12_19375 [Myxococcota bacterium]
MNETADRGYRRYPLYFYPLLLRPGCVDEALRRVAETGLVDPVPNLWQVSLGVLRMWHRVIFRFDSIGTSSGPPVRRTWRARAFRFRPIRFPFLLRERAVAPLDFSGLVSSRERIIRHLLGAHHDRDQFVYDLELLSLHPGALPELEARVRAVVDGSDHRAEWLKDLVVFEEYHETLLLALQGTAPKNAADKNDPDISLRAYLRWCAAQPTTPRASLAAAMASLWPGSMSPAT